LEHKDELREIIKKSGIVIEDTVLASGKKSQYYYDVKQAMLTPRALSLAGMLGFEIARMSNVKSVGGLESGAIPFATAISMSSASSVNPMQLFFVRKQSKAHGRGKWIEGNFDSPAAVVDDVVTTGTSSLIAIDRLVEAGCNVATVIALVDREEGASDAFASRGIKFAPIFTHSHDFKQFIDERLALKSKQ
jgi:orotate phosphoribosyltransferase